jgi:hypothetical protein
MAAETPCSSTGDTEERRFDRKENSDVIIKTAGR